MLIILSTYQFHHCVNNYADVPSLTKQQTDCGDLHPKFAIYTVFRISIKYL